jgi:CheY-like chemotaxis protein
MGPAMRVLIACSDASVRDAFLDVLRRTGIGVIAVADWAATLELARRQRPDVVLVDDELPGDRRRRRPGEAGRRDAGFGARGPRRTVRPG